MLPEENIIDDVINSKHVYLHLLLGSRLPPRFLISIEINLYVKLKLSRLSFFMYLNFFIQLHDIIRKNTWLHEKRKTPMKTKKRKRSCQKKKYILTNYWPSSYYHLR